MKGGGVCRLEDLFDGDYDLKEHKFNPIVYPDVGLLARFYEELGARRVEPHPAY